MDTIISRISDFYNYILCTRRSQAGMFIIICIYYEIFDVFYPRAAPLIIIIP